MDGTLRRIGWLALALWLAPGGSLAGTCTGWFPDLDPDCQRIGRPDEFIAPVAQAFLFEDAFVVTGVQASYLRQEFPGASALGGGHADVAAGQLRLALTDRIGLVASKAGAMWVEPGNPLVPDWDTALPVTLGAKLALYQDPDVGRFASFVLRCGDAFEGGGDGALVPSLAGAARLGAFAFQGDLGGSWAFDPSYSSSVFWHLHAAYPGLRTITPFVQVSGMHWVDGGDGSATIPLSAEGHQVFQAPSISMRTVEEIYGAFEGADLTNLGAPGADGLDLVTGAVGLQLRLGRFTFSAAYEHPLTEHNGIIGDRVSAAVSLEL
jgi:hypothetical protein